MESTVQIKGTPFMKDEWIKQATGLYENQWMNRRGELIQQLEPLDQEHDLGPHLAIKTPSGLMDCGAFRVWTLRELEDAVVVNEYAIPQETENKNEETDNECTFEVHYRLGNDIRAVDVNQLQASMRPQEGQGGIMFQVASNFNACENGSVYCTVDSGDFVTGLMSDFTQGPAAACQLAALTRTHAAFFSTETPARTWGQTNTHQVELIGTPLLAPHFPVANGKLYEVDALPPPPETPWLEALAKDEEALLYSVCAGLHCNVVVNHVRVARNTCALVADPPVIDQCFVAGLNLHARAVNQVPVEELISKMQFLLRAAYECTYAATLLRKSSVLVLTCIGGGVFDNPLSEVVKAMAVAHVKWVGRSGGCLKKVILPLFPKEVDAQMFVKVLKEAGVKNVVARGV